MEQCDREGRWFNKEHYLECHHCKPWGSMHRGPRRKCRPRPVFSHSWGGVGGRVVLTHKTPLPQCWGLFFFWRGSPLQHCCLPFVWTSVSPKKVGSGREVPSSQQAAFGGGRWIWTERKDGQVGFIKRKGTFQENCTWCDTVSVLVNDMWVCFYLNRKSTHCRRRACLSSSQVPPRGRGTQGGALFTCLTSALLGCYSAYVLPL